MIILILQNVQPCSFMARCLGYAYSTFHLIFALYFIHLLCNSARQGLAALLFTKENAQQRSICGSILVYNFSSSTCVEAHISQFPADCLFTLQIQPPLAFYYLEREIFQPSYSNKFFSIQFVSIFVFRNQWVWGSYDLVYCCCLKPRLWHVVFAFGLDNQHRRGGVWS